MLKREDLIEFAGLGMDAELPEKDLLILEKFACLWRSKGWISGSTSLQDIFIENREGKVLDRTLLQANYVAHMYGKANELVQTVC